MSRYLIREIEAAQNVAVRLGTRVVDGGGRGRLENLVLEDSASGLTENRHRGRACSCSSARNRTPTGCPRRSRATRTATSSPAGTSRTTATAPRMARGAPPPAAGDEHARRLRRRGRAPRRRKTGRLGRRRGFHRHPDGPRVPEPVAARRVLDAGRRANDTGRKGGSIHGAISPAIVLLYLDLPVGEACAGHGVGRLGALRMAGYRLQEVVAFQGVEERVRLCGDRRGARNLPEKAISPKKSPSSSVATSRPFLETVTLAAAL